MCKLFHVANNLIDNITSIAGNTRLGMGVRDNAKIECQSIQIHGKIGVNEIIRVSSMQIMINKPM